VTFVTCSWGLGNISIGARGLLYLYLVEYDIIML